MRPGVTLIYRVGVSFALVYYVVVRVVAKFNDPGSGVRSFCVLICLQLKGGDFAWVYYNKCYNVTMFWDIVLDNVSCQGPVPRAVLCFGVLC